MFVVKDFSLLLIKLLKYMYYKMSQILRKSVLCYNYASDKDTDQPVHMHCLIAPLIFFFLAFITSALAKTKNSKLATLCLVAISKTALC